MRKSAHASVRLIAISAVLALAWAGAMPVLAQAPTPQLAAGKVSRFGEYKGYSEAVYDGWVRTSRYLTMRDGVRLAADIIRPTLKGKVEEKPLPAIFVHTRYRRASLTKDGKIASEADSPISQVFLKHGYVLVVVDVRGSGASFGTWQGLFSPDETHDAYEVIEWLAAQPWCTGKIGMTGGSYLGTTQLMAASTHPPHLAALFPMVPLFDIYAVGFHNGVFFSDLIKTWSDFTMILDTKMPAAPVDEDRDGALLKQALAEHARGRSTFDIFAALRFRDSRDAVTGAFPMRDWTPSGHFREISDSRIPMYVLGGWFDSFTRDAFLIWKNFDVPKKLTVGAWSHSPRNPEIQKEEFYPMAVEELRWFDHWLKGIDNGIMEEPAIRYQVMKTLGTPGELGGPGTPGKPGTSEWRTAETWPIPEAKPTDLYLDEGSDRRTPGDHALSASKSEEVRQDPYTVDFTTTSGTTTRWDNAVGGGFGYPDMAANDKKSLTYTTPVLRKDVEVTGHPVVHLWVSSTAGDGGYFAYLEEVDADGVSHYVTEGTIKASHRAVTMPPYDYLGLPFHRSYAEDTAAPKPGEPVELVFDMQPTSNVFNRGNRIRLTIACADKDNAETKVTEPAPVVTIYRGGKMPSRLTLPVIGGLVDAVAAEKANTKWPLGSGLRNLL